MLNIETSCPKATGIGQFGVGCITARHRNMTGSRIRPDTVGKSFELNDAATKGGENAHWNSRTSYSYPWVYPEKIET